MKDSTNNNRTLACYHIHKNCNPAITLAEILITIGIIGIIAAITLPTLIRNYKKQVTANRLEKIYSTLGQAINLSEVDNGPYLTWEYNKSYKDFVESY